ncbi:MAG TPA: molybdopterin-guanine dinucleotide biosynthesis protein B, partial [Elusimicrobia bacterium]|nr:molybdopterin-guanine dinucleotide biosynthesis protein B [Elusimicrobiota bacterium]
MIPIISVVGKSGSGKTKFLTKLVPELKKRGYKVAVIKHDVHSRIDLPNKDTWQISKAGAKPVLIAGPKKMAVLRDLDKEKNLDDLAEYCSDVDLILTEGYKKENKPKIEVYSQGSLLSAENELLAVVSAKRINCSVPQFRFKEMKKVVELIEKKYLLGK